MRAIRGATHLQADDRDEMMVAVAELIAAMLERNAVDREHLISIILTSTPDLRCSFPATAARSAGLDDVPLLSAQEIDVPGAMPRVVRVMAHVDTDRGRADIDHVYLRGTEGLRR